MSFRLDCTETGNGLNKQASVAAVITDDKTHPELIGKRVVLDAHEGFWDFINTWVADRTSLTEITIDYVVLD